MHDSILRSILVKSKQPAAENAMRKYIVADIELFFQLFSFKLYIIGVRAFNFCIASELVVST